MRARNAERPVAPGPLVRQAEAEASAADTSPWVTEGLGPPERPSRGAVEAEEELDLVRGRFEHVEDPELQGELAAEALDYVERQLRLTRERRRQLDRAEAKLWARQNRLEGFLIRTRGSAWWHARRDTRRTEALGTDEGASAPGSATSYDQPTAT